MAHVIIDPDLCTDVQRETMARWLRQGLAWAHPFEGWVAKRCINAAVERDRLNIYEGFPLSAMRVGE